MAVLRQGTTVVGRLNDHNTAIRELAKNHGAAISTLQSQASKTDRVATATAATVAGFASQVTTDNITPTQITNPNNGNPVLGYTGSASLPALTTDSNTGTDWGTGERNFINNLNSNVNFILAVLRDAGIIGD